MQPIEILGDEKATAVKFVKTKLKKQILEEGKSL